MNLRSWSLVGAGLLLWQAAPAQTPPPRTWLAPLGAEAGTGAGMISEKFDEATRTELRKSRRVELRGDVRPATPNSPGGGDPRVDQAENLRTAAKASFAKKDYDTALKQLQGALAFYEEGIASVNKLEAVTETLGYLGACSLSLGFDDDAKDYFQRVLAIMPDAAPLDDYPVQSVELFEKLKKQAAKKKKATVVVRTEPAGAMVKIDGQERGNSPVTVSDLARGEHYIQAYQEQAGLAGTKVDLKGGKSETVDLKLSTTVGPEPSEPVDPALVRELARMAADGKLGAPFREKADRVGELTKAHCLVVGHVEAQGNGYVLAAYVYSTEQKQTAALDEARFRADLSSVNVQADTFAHAVEDACNKFPYDKIVVGGVVARTAPPPPAPVSAAPEPPPAPATEAPKRRPLPEAVTLDSGDSLENNDKDDGAAWYDHWWVYGTAGVLVVGGAVAAGVLFTQDEPKSNQIDAKVSW